MPNPDTAGRRRLDTCVTAWLACQVSGASSVDRGERRVHAVSVRHSGDGEWAWELIDPDGVTVAHGKAWTYSEAIGRAWAAERAARVSGASAGL